MNLMDYRTEVSNLRHVIGQARAVSTAFGNEYVDGTDKHVIACSIEASPDAYEYLFAALESILHEAWQLAEKLDGAEIEHTKAGD